MDRKLKKTALLILAIVLFGNVFAQETVKLETLDLTNGQQSYASMVANKSVVGEPLSVAGEKFERGVGVHAQSNLKLKLNNTRRFTAKVGINDNGIDYSANDIKSIPLTDGKRMFYKVGESSKQFIGVEGEDGNVDKGSVVFKLIHKGKEVFNSGIMRQGDKAKEIELELRGGVLEMIVEDAGDGVSGDHAVWLEPTFEFFEIAPATVKSDYLGEVVEQDSKITAHLKNLVDDLPQIELPLRKSGYDWLIDSKEAKAGVYSTGNSKDIVLTNGLIARTFRVIPNLATIDYVNQMNGEDLLRAVSNEGTLTIDGKRYNIGGLSNQPDYGYTLMEWVDDLSVTPNSFIVSDFKVKELSMHLAWKQVRWAGNTSLPTGKEIVFTLEKDDIEVKVHFALYDGIPTISKWIEVKNRGEMMYQLNAFNLEQLAMVNDENTVSIPDEWKKPNIHVETDYAFHGFFHKTSDHTTNWVKDPRFTSQVNYPLAMPCILEVRPPLGPEVGIQPGETFTTFRVWEMPYDSREEERKGLFARKMYRTIAPWVTENPIFLHLTSTKPEVVKEAVDQCAAVGFEMVILSFGSGLNMENESEENYKKFRELTEYANSKGIELGGYSLLSSRWISDEVDVINPKTGKRGGMIHGSQPCLCSEWGYDYFRKIKKFYEKTGMQFFENDGAYPGNVCASTSHAHHNGLEDSQWKQFAQIQGLYKWMRSEGIYMNIPDYYFLSGSSKVGIGYREVNWSLPRTRQLVHGRMNIFDGLWNRTPSMCWTFVPLTQYHGGGAAATLEPLKDHLHDYENHMMQNFGSGVQAFYRGHRLYDAPETKELVSRTIDWYKKYRDILNSDIIHLKRASGKDWDGFLHVNSECKEKGLAMFFNPTGEEMEREITLPLYYTGLSTEAKIRVQEGKPETYKLSRDYKVKVKITIPAHSYNWIVIE